MEHLEQVEQVEACHEELLVQVGDQMRPRLAPRALEGWIVVLVIVSASGWTVPRDDQHEEGAGHGL